MKKILVTFWLMPLFQLQQDYIEKNVRRTPHSAVAELIWNSLDGDAERINLL